MQDVDKLTDWSKLKSNMRDAERDQDRRQADLNRRFVRGEPQTQSAVL